LFDVAVIGAGPAGSRTALQLAGGGHNVVVFEKHPVIGCKNCCTGILSQKCLAQYSVPEKVIYRRLNSARLFSPSGQSLRVCVTQPQAGIVNRPQFDQWLAEQANSAGVKYRLNCEVTQLNPVQGAVEIEYCNAGFTCKAMARAVVLADGFNSVLARRSGLGQPVYQATGVQAEVEAAQCEEVEVYFSQKLAPGFFAWLAPTRTGKALAGLMTRESPQLHLRRWLHQLAAEHRIEKREYPVKFCGIPLKPLNSTVRERLLVVGDAAGQVKPTTGGGVYWGMLCADIAAQTLHNAIENDDFSRRSLSQYEKEWHALLRPELQREYFARRAYQLLSDNQIESLLTTIRHNGIADTLIRNDYASFDNHGALLLKALKLGLVSHAKRFSAYFTR
jgi:digeranylgeranylglycerophospholipid reductase